MNLLFANESLLENEEYMAAVNQAVKEDRWPTQDYATTETDEIYEQRLKDWLEEVKNLDIESSLLLPPAAAWQTRFDHLRHGDRKEMTEEDYPETKESNLWKTILLV